jgi:hypothetical protein
MKRSPQGAPTETPFSAENGAIIHRFMINDVSLRWNYPDQVHRV